MARVSRFSRNASIQKTKPVYYEDPLKSNDSSQPLILIISPIYRRITLLLERVLRERNNIVTCVGTDLYRQALEGLNGNFCNRVVALIVTDRTSDYKSETAEQPLWKAVVSLGHKQYLEAFQKEMEENIFPTSLTVITMFREDSGQMTEDNVNRIALEFYSFLEENSVRLITCPTEEAMPEIVRKEIVEVVMKRQRNKDPEKKYEPSRAQKLAKARKFTADAIKRQMKG